MSTRKKTVWCSISLGALVLVQAAAPVAAQSLPLGLPRYDLEIKLDPAERQVHVRQHVVWTNRHRRPTKEIVLNVHSHYSIPSKDIGLLAKTVELMRVAPSEALSFEGPACDILHVTSSDRPRCAEVERSGLAVAAVLPEQVAPCVTLPHAYRDATTLAISLPTEVGPGESVACDIEFRFRIPNKMGRWSSWDGVTALAQWLPVVAYYDDKGWQPVPFIPWHQPFFNEAGIYTAKIVLPVEQRLACTGSITCDKKLDNGWREVHVAPVCARDFAIVCSARFQECVGHAGLIRARCLALPEHEFYAKEMVKIACEALVAYERWFGPYPYPELDLVEAFFGWNGNECGGLVMVDSRMFAMPHAARNYIDLLVAHEICHQWWYNVVGTNGYAETWMDEGLATYFSHRLANQKAGSAELLKLPAALQWSPNVRREDFRNYTMLGVVARGQATPTVQPMEKFGNLVTLMGMTYDRGSRIVGMIEERMGEANFLDFMRRVYKKYYFQVMRVADFQRELEDYTGRSWQEYFQGWLYSSGMADWSVDDVQISPAPGPRQRRGNGPLSVTVQLSQHGDCNEPTVLGFRFHDKQDYGIRIPIYPDVPYLEVDEFQAIVQTSQELGGSGKTVTRVRVDILLPATPAQISVDPDGVVIDSQPCNNHWKAMVRWRFTPLYTQLDEADVTNAHDRWNVILGPWVYGSSYTNPWFTRSAMMGVRAGAYRTQEFAGGAYLALRSNDRNIVAGVDALWDHAPFCNTQIGCTIEQRLATLGPEDIPCSRAVLFGRYVFLPGSSLYLPPFEYLEAFAAVQNRCLPAPLVTPPGADPFNVQTPLGLHYHKYMLTPYWDPEGGCALDICCAAGLPVFGERGFQMAFGQASCVKNMPRSVQQCWDNSAWHWLTGARWAFRLNGAVALPDNGLFFALGGGDNFRGFDLNQRQGAATWVASVEWRLPAFQRMDSDFIDHCARLHGIYVVPFYDAGNAYYRWKPEGPVAHAIGIGLRCDVAWLSVIERTMLRFDVAQTLNADSPVQFWFGIQHPF